MAEINLKKLLDESMLKEIDQDCIILNEEQADELYGGAEWGYYGNCSTTVHEIPLTLKKVTN